MEAGEYAEVWTSRVQISLEKNVYLDLGQSQYYIKLFTVRLRDLIAHSNCLKLIISYSNCTPESWLEIR